MYRNAYGGGIQSPEQEGSDDYTDLFLWNIINIHFCQLTTKVLNQTNMQMYQKPHVSGLKTNRGM